MIVKSIAESVGNTPLAELVNYQREAGVNARLLAKLEYFNPTGSVKDRAALFMIKDAEARGLLAPGGTIIEPTSGNTGIGLAAIAASRGYRAILTMPDTMSEGRRKLLAAYGAELVLTEGALGMAGAIQRAGELHKSLPGSIIAGQFTNPANPRAHELTTGPELWRDTNGKLDIFVAGIGTGGTITGTARYLKSENPAIRICGFEPERSPFLTQGKAGPHGLQGIGAGFKPDILDMTLIDEVLTVGDDEAMEAMSALSRREGIFAGITSGAAVCAAIKLAKRPENAGKTIVALLPDSGDRYI